MKRLFLIIPRLTVSDANALSSSLTIGFPAITAWLGFVHKMERELRREHIEISFPNLGIVIHDFDLAVFKGVGDYNNSIVGKAYPLSKEGERSSFIEEARCNLNVSLAIECQYAGSRPFSEIGEIVQHILHSKMKLAGGDIQKSQSPYLVGIEDNEEGYMSIIGKIPFGFIPIERRDLLKNVAAEDNLDELLDSLAVSNFSEIDADEDAEKRVSWNSKRKHPGWIVPLVTGYQGLGQLYDAGETLNTRDSSTPHRFVESIVTLGEFVSPYSLSSIDDMLWSYDYDSENSQYLCRNQSV
ncbi:type I-F CRISPR-associated protein Csy2 [Pseudobacteriovorax antillogorgiicola]|uniref:CRISPR-associated protein, Csy2 family n=1 Tax=Pseudobacteriovorax antillogorgiicola TaxID=1513793 RepID=A0A1Y6C3Z3_9BACT|nr:type I-F CRISPR-associated protein Csy2 [Pseudobacteriovorax antillogorgiicola]TCS49876.1 CRISPR-associated Csy2 family protein [Pseudobacteriovorax antillogorgiicola]SMF44315.1 CRISPR-associated protein, Csy2 family [Pseudobacteriovorax antillogorgiicola]